MGETYYEVLEVEADASRDEIEAAYRDRILETHPDHNDAPDAAEQFRRVSTAKSVLADGAERARYDRLGHDAYVRLARRTADSSDSDAGETADPGAHATGSGRNGESTSHHARQRAGRQRTRARQRAADPWSFGTTAGSTGSAGASAGASRASSTGSAGASSTTDTESSSAGSTATGGADATASSGVQYTVHGWDGEIELEWDGRPIEHTTAVTIGCLWVLYPVFVAASLTSVFPVVVNAVVAACALGSVGYLLTRPRVAAAVFGSWSLLFPLGMAQTGAVAPLSVVGLLVLGFVWVPFGYALTLWWALRP